MAMKFSVAVPHGALGELVGVKDPVEAYENMTQIARMIEDAGFETLWISDVLWPAGSQPSQNILFECWTTTAALARDTKRIRIGQMVTHIGLRNPALLAKMASTVDVMSHGRLIAGIGSGSPILTKQIRAYGFDTPDVAVRSRQLREVIQILLAMWTQEEATFEGKYYQVRGAINSPKGVQKPHIPLLIAGSGEQVTLKLVAQYGNACNVYGDPATIKQKLTVLKQHCEAVGRDYQEIHRTAGAMCIIEDSDELAQEKFSLAVTELSNEARALLSQSALIGSPATIRKLIEVYEAAGVQELVLRFPEIGQKDVIQRTIQLFKQEIID